MQPLLSALISKICNTIWMSLLIRITNHYCYFNPIGYYCPNAMVFYVGSFCEINLSIVHLFHRLFWYHKHYVSIVILHGKGKKCRIILGHIMINSGLYHTLVIISFCGCSDLIPISGGVIIFPRLSTNMESLWCYVSH